MSDDKGAFQWEPERDDDTVQEVAARLCDGCREEDPRVGDIHVRQYGRREKCEASVLWDVVAEADELEMARRQLEVELEQVYYMMREPMTLADAQKARDYLTGVLHKRKADVYRARAAERSA